MEIKGVKIGLLGTNELGEYMDCEEVLIETINSLNGEGAQIQIASFHWGVERYNVPDETQVELAHSAIDHGADLVLGHHPHVLQGIETYKGKNIIYSLANFCFGGNSTPSDTDTIIFRQTFTIEEGDVGLDDQVEIIPCSISSASGYNNYQPTPAAGSEADRIMAKLNEYCTAFGTSFEASDGLTE